MLQAKSPIRTLQATVRLEDANTRDLSFYKQRMHRTRLAGWILIPNRDKNSLPSHQAAQANLARFSEMPMKVSSYIRIGSTVTCVKRVVFELQAVVKSFICQLSGDFVLKVNINMYSGLFFSRTPVHTCNQQGTKHFTVYQKLTLATILKIW